MSNKISSSFLFLMTFMALVESKLVYNFHNQTHSTMHVCSTDFREFSRQILIESVLMQTTQTVCRQYGIRVWQYVVNLTQMPVRMNEVYKFPDHMMSECASLKFQDRVAVPGMLNHFVPHAQLNVSVDVFVRGAHAYHTVYLTSCPILGRVVFSHDINAWTHNKNLSKR